MLPDPFRDGCQCLREGIGGGHHLWMYNRESGTPPPKSTLFSLGISSLFSLDDLGGEGYQSSGLRAAGFLLPTVLVLSS